MTPQRTTDSGQLFEWQPTAAGNAELRLGAVVTGGAPALRMDFDFKGGAGFVVARRQCARSMPAQYAVHFRLRGRGAVNDLELKLVDTTGQNTWRHVIRGLRPPARWKHMKIDSQDIDFAWGPSSGRGIAQLGAIEFAVVAGEGGQGTLWIADLNIEDCGPTEAPRVSASSETPEFAASQALGDAGWKPLSDDPRPRLVIDVGQPRRVGGLTIDWLGEAPAGGFRVSASNTGRRFRTVHEATRAGGKRSNVYLPGLKTRFLSLEIGEPSAGAALRLQPPDYSRSIDAFWHTVADAEVRGWHPRWLHREQSLWTPIGISDGTQCALMNADGMVEVGQGLFSIEPMLLIDHRLYTWADVTLRLELRDEWIPVPSVIWETAGWRLRIQAEATLSQTLQVRFRVENLGRSPLRARLFVLVRPFQVTPPWQSFREFGGVSRIVDLRLLDGAVLVNEKTLIVPLTAPAGFGSMGFDDGFIAARLLAGALPGNTRTHDTFGFATGALDFELSLEAGESASHALNCLPREAARRVDDAGFDWSTKVPASQWAGNGWATEVIQAALTATAHILVTRRGAALQPGPRRYTRSWIRDGAMMSAALLRMRRMDEVRAFIRWYAPHQRADGFVPCCVDGEGIDWLVEHDSHGQLIAVIADYFRFSSDVQFLQESWIYVDRAVGCIERLLGPDGLLPISVSHEGYLAQPVHSYWDDFWALRGLRDSVELARRLGLHDRARRSDLLATRFAASLFDSIEATRARHRLDFIPGSVEWADFDPTATANALYLHDVPDGLNRKATERTFDVYLADWRAKRSGALDWSNYTPYEIRIIGAFVRLGRRDAALELLKFFLSDRRPPKWNQWPEIAWHDQQAPAHVGDLPHTWIAAEYVLAVRSLFAYERESDGSLILAAGLASEWLDGSGVRVDAMPTIHGNLSYSLRRIDSHTLRFEIGRFEIGDGITPQVILRPPVPTPIRSVLLNGSAWSGFDGESVTVRQTPVEITCISF